MARRKKDKWDGDERRGAVTVLIAGDNADANELLSRVLAVEGLRPVTATSVDAATARAVEQLPRAAVVDLGGGGVSASLQFLDWVRSNEDDRISRCRVVIVARSSANRTFAFQSGADDFLQRPFHASELVAAITEALSTSQADMPARRRQLLDRKSEPAAEA